MAVLMLVRISLRNWAWPDKYALADHHHLPLPRGTTERRARR